MRDTIDMDDLLAPIIKADRKKKMKIYKGIKYAIEFPKVIDENDLDILLTAVKLDYRGKVLVPFYFKKKPIKEKYRRTLNKDVVRQVFFSGFYILDPIYIINSEMVLTLFVSNIGVKKHKYVFNNKKEKWVLKK